MSDKEISATNRKVVRKQDRIATEDNLIGAVCGVVQLRNTAAKNAVQGF